jgi:putative ABC transport system permease protein
VVEKLRQDIGYGIRRLWKNPAITLAAVFALALGIGANTAIFSLVNALVLRPLPYENPDQIILLSYALTEASPANFLDWKAQSQSFDNISALGFWSANLTAGNEPERLQGFQTSASLFPMLGVRPALGRTYVAEEEQPGKDNVVVISDGLWKRAFASNPNIIGQTVSVNAKNYTVIGVMPPGFQYYRPGDIWSPLAFTPEDAKRRSPGNLIVAGRLKPNVTLAQAQSQMTTIAGRLEQQYPQTNTGLTVRLMSLHEHLMGPMRPALVVLLAAVIFVLMIACANVANLLLARAAARQKEIAIRLALGAGRFRIIRQLLTESILLGLLGGVLGLVLAFWGLRFLNASIPPTGASVLAQLNGISLDGRVLGFTLLISMLTGIIFGLAPALQISKPDLNETLKEGGRGTSNSRQSARLRSVLVISEVALALVLLVCAALMVSSFLRLLNVNPGFEPKNVLTMQTSLLQARYPEDAQVNAFYKRAIEQLSNLPGVESAGATSNLPLGGSNKVRGLEIEGSPAPGPGQAAPAANYRMVSSDYFKALGIRLSKGRYFTEQDTENSLPVVIINNALAKRYFANVDPLNKLLRRQNPQANAAPFPWMQVVGVVDDVRHSALTDNPRPEMYVPFYQNASRDMTFVVRTQSDPKSMASAAREQIHSIDKDQPVYNVQGMAEIVAGSAFLNRFSMSLLGIFAAVALILSSIGIYSLIAYSVTQRTNEIGIRMALGARPRDVLMLFVRQGMLLALIGIVIGALGAFGATRFLSSLLFGVSTSDVTTFAGTALLLALVVLVASYVPARRATKVDPMIAFRSE